VYTVKIFLNGEVVAEVEGKDRQHAMKKARRFIRVKLETSIKHAKSNEGDGNTAVIEFEIETDTEDGDATDADAEGNTEAEADAA